MKKLSIATRFTLIVLIILMIGQGSLWIWFVNGQRDHHFRSLNEKIKSNADMLIAISASAILSNDYLSLDQYIDVFARDEDIISVKVSDRNGLIIRQKVVRQENKRKNFNPFYIPYTNLYSASITTGNETIGNVEIRYSGERTNKNIKNLLTVSPVGQVIVFIFVVLAIFFFFQRTVGRPVEMINNLLSRVTAGDLTVKVPEMNQKEMDSMAKGLRFLIERFSDTIKKFYSISGNVVAAVEQLTLTLKNVSDAAARQSRAIDSIVTSIKSANQSQRNITESTERLSSAASENVTSLLEIRATAEEIASSTERLFKAVEDSYAMIAETSQTSKAIAESTVGLSIATESTTSSVNEINTSIIEVENNAKNSAVMASRVRELLTDRGTIAIADAIDAVEKIVDEVNRSSIIIRRLDERSKGIEKILQVIKEITEKTNLLSLNAAILAVQAGEYGKSFSVVADEIRNLSDRTSSSAKEIANIVDTIKKDIREAVDAIKVGVDSADYGKMMIFRAGEAMGQTLETAQKSAQMAKLIERATEEQAGALRQISISMENIQKMIEQVARATEEQEKSSSHMLDSIGDIKEVAEIVKKGTQEHASGTNLITKNIEITSSMVSQISQSAQEQLKVNEKIVTSVEDVKRTINMTATDIEEIALSLNTLREEIEAMKRETEIFRVQ
ncbi:MAG: methyl-accepting chemotaxis protein [Thermodesulfovibrionales bacterium]